MLDNFTNESPQDIKAADYLSSAQLLTTTTLEQSSMDALPIIYMSGKRVPLVNKLLNEELL